MKPELKIIRNNQGFKDGQISYIFEIIFNNDKLEIKLICNQGIDTQGKREYKYDFYQIKFDNLYIDHINRNECDNENELVKKTLSLCNRYINEKIKRFEKKRASEHIKKRILIECLEEV
jgi:hypothetical protein